MKLSSQHSKRGDIENGSIPDYCRFTTFAATFSRKFAGFGGGQLLESVLNQVLQAQATEQLSAEPYERTDERQGYRNGTDHHLLITRVGTITKFRK
jgi:hypothetical protein